MNVYDFDKTIYRRDSSTDFILYLFRRRPALLRFLPRQIGAALKHYVFRRITKTRMKECFFSLFSACPEGAEPYVKDFWHLRRNGIFDWYRAQHQADDVIISASPRFLLEPICRELGITQLLASETDPKTGRFDGLNCPGEEKLRRFREKWPEGRIEKFYSDSHSDDPLAFAADQAFLVHKNGSRTGWNRQTAGQKKDR